MQHIIDTSPSLRRSPSAGSGQARSTGSGQAARSTGQGQDAPAFRKPHFDCRGETGSLQLVVYVPGVDASGVNIEARGHDLIVTARKTHFVRVNWQALHLEGSQRDYRLRLRLGEGFAYETMQAEIHNGVLTITLPKRQGDQAETGTRLRRVA